MKQLQSNACLSTLQSDRGFERVRPIHKWFQHFDDESLCKILPLLLKTCKQLFF